MKENFETHRLESSESTQQRVKQIATYWAQSSKNKTAATDVGNPSESVATTIDSATPRTQSQLTELQTQNLKLETEVSTCPSHALSLSYTLSHSLSRCHTITHTHTSSLVLVVMTKSKQFKTSRSILTLMLRFSLTRCVSHAVSLFNTHSLSSIRPPSFSHALSRWHAYSESSNQLNKARRPSGRRHAHRAS